MVLVVAASHTSIYRALPYTQLLLSVSGCLLAALRPCGWSTILACVRLSAAFAALLGTLTLELWQGVEVRVCAV